MTQIPLHFLPGTQCNEQLWQQVFELLPPQFVPTALIIPEGNSPQEIVCKLHQRLNKKPLNLIGFSLGGYLSALYAVQYPDHINRLMIIANHPTALPKRELIVRQFTLDYIKKHGYHGMPTKRIQDLLSPIHRRHQDIISVIKAMDKICGERTLIEQLSHTSQRDDLLPLLNKRDFNTHFIVGQDDSLVNIEMLKQAIDSPRISLETIEQCGHMSPLESPAAIAQTITQHFG